MDFERILQMAANERNLALLHDEALVDDISEFLAIRQLYNAAIKQVRAKLEILDDEFHVKHCHNPIHHIESRIKSPASILEKLQRKGFAIELQSLRDGLLDIAGIRVVCNYLNDVELVAGLLLSQDDIHLIKRKDFITNPKPNGYRSLHLIISVPVYLAETIEDIPVEVQIRTIAMDYWASLEHHLKYKSENEASESLKSRLKRNADLLAEIDADLQDIYCQLNAQKSLL